MQPAFASEDLNSHVKQVEVRGNPKVEWRNYTVSTEWLELFHPFTAVQGLRVVGSLERFVVAVLQDLTGERTTTCCPRWVIFPWGYSGHPVRRRTPWSPRAGSSVTRDCWSTGTRFREDHAQHPGAPPPHPFTLVSSTYRLTLLIMPTITTDIYWRFALFCYLVII